jgi:hypothetical protein
MGWYNVVGTVHLASGFDFNVDAVDEDDARRRAEALIHEGDWDTADIQEVCFNNITRGDDAPAPEAKPTIQVSLTQEQINILCDAISTELDNAENAPKAERRRDPDLPDILRDILRALNQPNNNDG